MILGRQAVLERSRRAEAQIGARKRRVRVGVAHVAFLRRLAADVNRPAADLGNQVQHLVDRHARAAADVVGAPRNAARAGENRGRHGVPDEREVARLFAVPVHRDRRAVDGGFQETMKAHVRTLARAIHGEVAHRRGRHAVIDGVQVAQLLGGEFGHAVWRKRVRQRLLVHRDRRIVAVDRGARGVDELLDLPPDDRLQQDLRRVDVVGRVDLEVAPPALSHAGLRGQVKHVRHVVQQRIEIRVLNRRLHEPEPVVGRHGGEVRFLDRPRIVVREAVQSRDRGAAFEQRPGQVRADEPGDAGDERLH